MCVMAHQRMAHCIRDGADMVAFKKWVSLGRQTQAQVRWQVCAKTTVSNCKCVYNRDKTCPLSVLGLSGTELGSQLSSQQTVWLCALHL